MDASRQPTDSFDSALPGHRVLIRQVGPGSSMASDNAFAAALLSLWHRVSAAGGLVLFAPRTDRTMLAAAVADIIDHLKSGRAHAVAATDNREVIGFVLLRLQMGASAHTADVELLMVDPSRQRSGVGSLMMRQILELAGSRGLERVLVHMPAAGVAGDLPGFFSGFGFTTAGRLPGWIRLADGSTTDQILSTLELPPAPTVCC